MKPELERPLQNLVLGFVAVMLLTSVVFAQASSPGGLENREPAGGALLPDSPGATRSKFLSAQNWLSGPRPDAVLQDAQSENPPSAKELSPQSTDPVPANGPNSPLPVPPAAMAESGARVPEMPPAADSQNGSVAIEPVNPESAKPEPATFEAAKPDPLARPLPASTPHAPLGTALAQPLETTGVAASRPAGTAVAPAGQRRVRTILIRIGSLVGAGVAVGTTIGLSQGSPGRPPGSH